jgi:hypothetical protein
MHACRYFGNIKKKGHYDIRKRGKKEVYIYICRWKKRKSEIKIKFCEYICKFGILLKFICIFLTKRDSQDVKSLIV